MTAVNPMKCTDRPQDRSAHTAKGAQASKNSPSTGSIFRWRCFWTVMLGLHISALPSAWSALAAAWGGAETVATVFRLLLLATSSQFFVLKIVDVPWLRMLPGWRSTIAAVVVVAVLHVSVIDRVQGGEVARPSAHLGVGLVIGLLAELELRYRPRLERALRESPVRWCTTTADSLSPFSKVCDRFFVPRFTSILTCLVAPRAPPLG